MFLEANWDPSPHRNPPAALKQIKPQTREPWAIDADVYNKGKYATDTSDFGKPTRYGMDMDPPLTVSITRRSASKSNRARPSQHHRGTASHSGEASQAVDMAMTAKEKDVGAALTPP